ncbi:MAG TPA: hypothetical protein IAB98_12490 [Candidatus Egerieimonas intestinavium]|uniref:Uncharacterized protein n=1 Tax=Candidatus Egerieimonas intestinavium TaxID=2840777 RepID=A0A9D1JHE2_9FIRM|nr:hypothetical protein [Candidatus Egerieimonas intestinavium]
MIAIAVSDVKEMMKCLLLKEDFDSFYLTEAAITTFVTYTIDGQLHHDFYDAGGAEELKAREQYFARWGEVRSLCFQMIRGKRTPLHFKLVFQLPREKTQELLEASSLDCSPEDVFGLYLNCQYDGENLVLTTGTSLRFFTLDKSLDHLWDEYITDYLKEKKIH